ncbi:MAG TPA: alpha-L-fucosidase [Bryobacteraceae bacterium]|nr:alpha-L-fucosidase [Bryobacteraceae bacterium]
MQFTRRSLMLAAAGASLNAASGPVSFGALPSRRQLAWHAMETYAFLHFTTNTFTDKEWGFGDESSSIFNPTAFDGDAIVEALKAGGMKGVIITAKHHDGFCLWPTKTTQYSVASSTWRSGKGDVVGDLSRAAAKAGLKFGVYLSPWDRNSALYSQPAYVGMYRRQLTELMTQYGPLFEIWHDGANGGDGYYGGAREKRTIDKKTYYGWPETWALVRKHQPNACIFSDVGPDVRWVGNERGIAGETCWATCDPVADQGSEASPGNANAKLLNVGTRNGSKWLPAECDVSIRPGWFWHEKENERVKTPRQLMELYYKSVGRGANFLLNIPPDRRGLLHENDIASLKGFGRMVRETFAANLAAGGKATSMDTRPGCGAERLIDGKRDTFWAARDGVKEPSVVIEPRGGTVFNVLLVREAVALGQRIGGLAVDARIDGDWKTIGSATSIGACRIIKLDGAVKSHLVRLRVTEAGAAPALSEFGLYYENV